MAVFRFTLARASHACCAAFVVNAARCDAGLTRAAHRQGIPGFDDAQLPRVRAWLVTRRRALDRAAC